MKTKPSEALQSIADILLGNPKVHTKNYYARDAAGFKISESDEEACSFCSLGLIYAAANDLNASSAALERFLSQALSGGHIPTWNDFPKRTVGQVRKAFQKAADLAVEAGE